MAKAMKRQADAATQMMRHIHEERNETAPEELMKYKFKRIVAQVSHTDRFALYLGIRVDLILEWGS
ncbi:uncharacterized protein G2W53_026894 [Senna tora]|uniref:Uncharacterized protein n=1 Tax=Senna tora TaxID=362788 RepID=A0A834TI08_9FABA|nr:uncharacterized protein G2W53_026894 [Senna tora]